MLFSEYKSMHSCKYSKSRLVGLIEQAFFSQYFPSYLPRITMSDQNGFPYKKYRISDGFFQTVA